MGLATDSEAPSKRQAKQFHQALLLVTQPNQRIPIRLFHQMLARYVPGVSDGSTCRRYVEIMDLLGLVKHVGGPGRPTDDSHYVEVIHPASPVVQPLLAPHDPPLAAAPLA
jgi:hypothetical protein